MKERFFKTPKTSLNAFFTIHRHLNRYHGTSCGGAGKCGGKRARKLERPLFFPRYEAVSQAALRPPAPLPTSINKRRQSGGCDAALFPSPPFAVELQSGSQLPFRRLGGLLREKDRPRLASRGSQTVKRTTLAVTGHERVFSGTRFKRKAREDIRGRTAEPSRKCPPPPPPVFSFPLKYNCCRTPVLPPQRPLAIYENAVECACPSNGEGGHYYLSPDDVFGPRTRVKYVIVLDSNTAR